MIQSNLLNDASLRRKEYIKIILKRIKPGSGSNLSLLINRPLKNIIMTNIKNIISPNQFVVVGGIATRLYMPERMTEDLDILINIEDQETIYQNLEKAGAKKIGYLSIGGTTWELNDGTLLDIIESDEPWIFEVLNNPNMDDQGLPIIALPYLILMKLQASRGIDIGDITRMLGNANEQMLNQIRAIIHQYMNDAEEDLESLITIGKLEYNM